MSTEHPPEIRLPGAELAALKADRNLYKGKYLSIIKLMDRTRREVQEIFDHIEDEGDRAYFGSTNHPDQLRDLLNHMDRWSFDAMLPKGDINKMERDPYAEIREQRSRANRVRAALKDAISHIEHMAAFIGPLKLGYSFESLGEDMPGMRNALGDECPAPQPNVTVNLLQWIVRGNSFDGPVVYAGAFGISRFYSISGTEGDWTLSYPSADCMTHIDGIKTQHAARAAAQDDYAMRTLATLAGEGEEP